MALAAMTPLLTRPAKGFLPCDSSRVNMRTASRPFQRNRRNNNMVMVVASAGDLADVDRRGILLAGPDLIPLHAHL